MKYIIFFIVITLIIRIAPQVIKIALRKRKRKQIEQLPQEYEDVLYYEDEIYPYHKQYLLTKNEFYFYKKLLPLTQSLNLQILTKVRLADLLEVDSGLPAGEWHKYFNRIKSKHIDFAIVDDMRVIILIELDDSSHNRQDRTERDTFVNKALCSAGYIVVRTYGDTQIVEQALYDNGYYLQ